MSVQALDLDVDVGQPLGAQLKVDSGLKGRRGMVCLKFRQIFHFFNENKVFIAIS